MSLQETEIEEKRTQLEKSADEAFQLQSMQNLEAEQGLLGAILIENESIWNALGIVKPEDFYSPVHGEIFRQCAEAIQAGKRANAVTFKQAFQDHPDLRSHGGAAYLGELEASVVSVFNVPDYARLIADLAERRRMLGLFRDTLSALAKDTRSAAEISAEIIKRLSDNGGGLSNVKTKRQVAREAVEAIQLPPNCYSTGLACLDEVMSGGLYAGFTYGMAGQEKRGKTTLAHTISHNLNEAGHLHAYLALEMGSRQIEARNLARMANVNSMRFLNSATRNDMELLRKVAGMATSVKDNTLYLDMPGATFDQIQIELSRLVSRHKIKGFILDYWQLIEGQGRNETEERHLRRTAQWIAGFSRRHGVWNILLAQLNDEGRTFAGRGLVKACDQLYNIELAETGSKDQEIWLKMTHSRYTPLKDVGTKREPLLYVNKRAGPHIAER